MDAALRVSVSVTKNPFDTTPNLSRIALDRPTECARVRSLSASRNRWRNKSAPAKTQLGIIGIDTAKPLKTQAQGLLAGIWLLLTL
jgi:hypothetical protein